MTSSSSSANTTQTATTDKRILLPNGGIGVSSDGDVSVNVVADEAFELAALSVDTVADALGDAQGRFLDGAQELTGEVLDANGAVLDEYGENQIRTLDAYADTLDNLLRSQGDTQREVLAANDSLSRFAITTVADSFDDTAQGLQAALFRTQDSAKTESTQIADKLIKIGIPAAALIYIVGKMT